MCIRDRLDVVHRDLGLVVAIGIEVLRRDAQFLFGQLHDRPFGGLLGNLDVGLRASVLRRGHRTFPLDYENNLTLSWSRRVGYSLVVAHPSRRALRALLKVRKY